jgi:uncharacterized membrane protein YdfJ with MMPL/SSD domain
MSSVQTIERPARTRFTARLSQLVYRRRRAILAGAILLAAISAVFGFGVAGRLDPFGATDPATQSVQATNRFEASTGRRIEPDVIALVRVGNVATPAAHARVERVASQLARQPGVVAVQSFYSTRDPAMVSFNRRLTYVDVFYRSASDKQVQQWAKALAKRFAQSPYVTLGGDGVANAQVNTLVGSGLAHAELLAFPIIVLLSILFFRSLVASFLPPLLGGLTIVITFLVMRLVSELVGISVYALNFVIGLGLGLAIDYSLFIVSRYREEASVHGFGPEALQRTLRSAGKTVVFSAITVAASVASLCLFPQEFLYSMGIAGAVAALLAMTLALTVLPALLAVLGPRVNAGSPRFLARAAEREARPMTSGFWYRLSHFVMRRPIPVALIAAAVLIVLGSPLLGIKFTPATAQVLPASQSARQVADVMNRSFTANHGDPVDLVLGSPAGAPATAALRAFIARLPGVASVTAPAAAGSDGTILYAFTRHRPLAPQSKQLVRAIRALHPAFYLGVAGTTASFLDLESSLKSHLPLVLAAVIVATLLMLFLMTGSVVLPLKAVAMNALTLSAMLGILVWVFQDGHLQGLLSFSSEGALDATMPVFLAAVGFGLATDYGVFLLGRIKEAHDGGLNNREAVAQGLERTGRIVTAAALLFAVAIGAFVTSNIVFIKELGLGAALAVLIDASVIRALLVPALMTLLGQANWWAPAPLRRLHDRLRPGDGEPAG